MNACIPMPDGTLHALTVHEAEVLRAFLGERLVHGGEADQPAVLNLIRHVDRVMAPETHFDDVYAPRGYEAGWKADP